MYHPSCFGVSSFTGDDPCTPGWFAACFADLLHHRMMHTHDKHVLAHGLPALKLRSIFPCKAGGSALLLPYPGGQCHCTCDCTQLCYLCKTDVGCGHSSSKQLGRHAAHGVAANSGLVATHMTLCMSLRWAGSGKKLLQLLPSDGLNKLHWQWAFTQEHAIV